MQLPTVTIFVNKFIENENTVKPWGSGNGQTLIQFATVKQVPHAQDFSFVIQHFVNNGDSVKDVIMEEGTYQADVLFEPPKDKKYDTPHRFVNYRGIGSLAKTPAQIQAQNKNK